METLSRTKNTGAWQSLQMKPFVLTLEHFSADTHCMVSRSIHVNMLEIACGCGDVCLAMALLKNTRTLTAILSLFFLAVLVLYM